jgi:hypothetical protein
VRILYYIILSLYGAINAVIGLQIVLHYILSPGLFANALGDVVVGAAMLAIGVLCLLIFVARDKPQERYVALRRRSSMVLAFVAIPLLMISLTVDFFESDTIKPAYCDLNTDVASAQKYICDIRALDLDMLNDPQLSYAKDFATGRSSKIFVANSLSFLVAAAIGIMVAVRTLRIKPLKH